MSTDEYMPSEQDLEVAWIEFEASAEDINVASAEAERAIAHIRRDAWAECARAMGASTEWINRENPC